MFVNNRNSLYINNYPQANFEVNIRTNKQGISNPFNFERYELDDKTLLFNANTNLLDNYKTDENFVRYQRTYMFNIHGYEIGKNPNSIIDLCKENELKHLEKPEIVATLYKTLYNELSDKQKSLPEVGKIKKNINLLLEQFNNAGKNTTQIEKKIDFELFKLKALIDSDRTKINPFYSIINNSKIDYTMSLINTDNIGEFLDLSSDLDFTIDKLADVNHYSPRCSKKDLSKFVGHIAKTLLLKAQNVGIGTKDISKQIKSELKKYEKNVKRNIKTSTKNLNNLFRCLYSQIAEKEGLEPLSDNKYINYMHKYSDKLLFEQNPGYWYYKREYIKKDDKKYDEKFIKELITYHKIEYPQYKSQIEQIEKNIIKFIEDYKMNNTNKDEIDNNIDFEFFKLKVLVDTKLKTPFIELSESTNLNYFLPYINSHTIGDFLNISSDINLTLNVLKLCNEHYIPKKLNPKDKHSILEKTASVLLEMAKNSQINTDEISKEIEMEINNYKSAIEDNPEQQTQFIKKLNELFRTLYSQIAQKNNLQQLDNSRYNNLIPAAVKELETTYLFDVLNKYIDIKNKEEVKDFLLKIFDYQTNNNKDIKDLRESYILVIEKIIRELESNSSDIKFWINYYGNDLLDKIRRTWERKNLPDTPNIEINQNGLIDRDFQQGSVGSCWLLSSIKSLASNSQTAQMLNANITIDEEGNTHVKLLGPNKTYIVTREELLSHSDYSMGDYDIRAIEIAVNKYLLEERKKDVDGGTQFDAMNILHGNSITTITTAGDTNLLEIKNNKFEKALNEKIIEKLPELVEHKNLVFSMGLGLTANKGISGEIVGKNSNTTLSTRHAYGVVNIDKNYIYISDPHDSKKTIKVLLKDIIDGGGTLTISESKDSNILKGIVLESLSEYINGQIEQLKDEYISEYDFDKYYKEISSLINFINNSDINDEKKEELKTLLLNYFSQFLIDNEYLMDYTFYDEDSRAKFKDKVTKLRQFVTENFNGDKKLMEQIDKILFSDISLKNDRFIDYWTISLIIEILNKQAIKIDETFPENTTTKITAKQEIIDIYIEQIKKGKKDYYYCKKKKYDIDAVKDFEALCSSATKFLEDNKDIKELKTFELSSLLTLINPPDYTEEEQKEIFTQMTKSLFQQTYKNSPFAQYMNIMN